MATERESTTDYLPGTFAHYLDDDVLGGVALSLGARIGGQDSRVAGYGSSSAGPKYSGTRPSCNR